MGKRYVEVARFPSRLEAETVGHALDEHGIPFLVQCADIGMFGPGMTGFSPEGAGLQVPEDAVEEVSRLISCVVRPLDEGELVELEAAREAELEGTAESRDSAAETEDS